MNWNHYRFVSVWELPAPPGAVYAQLERVEDYPLWWPQVREAGRSDDGSGTTRIRSVLPYDLVTTVRERRRDPANGILEAGLVGDLDGWARWTVTAYGPGTRVVYEQEVEVRRTLIRVLALPCRPVFRVNHALMMRAGRRGLAARLQAV
ncbi:polyketide cyclase [Streptomyces sp. col6]|uniref:SRPBCC family protein n=1 Tax=Streptomyces sp. col6 TaxID=2478958 RepID=UPI0011CE5514|nr:SRPBCC family protein [Streptomyces sp. col6]TXS03546.1 polyketide cyclase [Streptomyces sp. col6]